MRILIAALADHASISQPGDKLNVNGVFDTLQATSFPVVLPSAALALRFQLDNDDQSATHTLEIVIVNQDGKEFTKLQHELEVGEIRPGNRVTVNQLVFFQQLTFRAPDRFSVIVRWNGDEQQRFPLDVLAVQAPPPDAAGA